MYKEVSGDHSSPESSTSQQCTNSYVLASFMQGGRPLSVAEATVFLSQDGHVKTSDGASGTWTSDGVKLTITWSGEAKAEQYCCYADSVTEVYRDHLFCYGKVLKPIKLTFGLPIKPVDDNPRENLKEHLARRHPDCKRVLSRACKDYFDIFPRNGTYLEVGVAYGNNALRIREALAPAALHLVDCWEVLEGSSDNYSQANLDDAYSAAVEKFGNDPTAIFHKGLSQEVLAKMSPAQFDMMYIDADHTEEACYRDLCLCERLVKPSGYLCGHDYTSHPNTADGAVARTNYGVIEAVDRFCHDHGWALRYLTIEVYDWCFPSYVLSRKV